MVARMFPISNTVEVQDPLTLGRLIQNRREAVGLTQAELAGYANVGRRFLLEVEAGKPTAQIGKVMSVLTALGLRVQVSAP